MIKHIEAVKLLQRHFDIALETPDGIKKLRALILTLAMQGKLVSQEPKDQPASELLKEIEAEKKRLVKEGKIKQNTRSSDDAKEIKASEVPYELPKGWEWVRLGEFVYIEMGQSPESAYYNQEGNGLPFFQGKADFGELYPAPRYWCTRPQKYAFPNDVLLSVRAPVGPTNISNIECCIGRGLAALRPIAGVSAYFVNYLMIRFRNTLESCATGTTFAAVSKSDVEMLMIPIPPLAEQKRIVAKIDQLMALCDKLEAERAERNQKRLTVHTAAMNRLLTAPDKTDLDKSWHFITRHFGELYSVPQNVAELKKAILQLAVMGKLVPQDPKDQPASELVKEIEEEKKRLVKEGKIKKQEPLLPLKAEEMPYAAPKSWEWVRFGNIAQHNSGKTLDKGRNTGQPRDYITTSNLYWGRFELDNVRQMLIRDDELEKCTARKNDLLICEGGEAGRAAVWEFDSEVCFQNHVHRARFYRDVDPYFAYRFFEKLNATGEINQHRKGVGISNMSSKALASIVFPLPPVTEQKRIIAKIDQLMGLCDALDKQIGSATKKQTAILNAVLAKV